MSNTVDGKLRAEIAKQLGIELKDGEEVSKEFLDEFLHPNYSYEDRLNEPQ